ncbi:MAG: enolase [Aquificales bacterium]|nr:enolase [Aquificales bacterium]
MTTSQFTIQNSQFIIKHVSTTVFRLPLHGRLQWGKHSILNELRHVLVRVRLSNGAEGVAEAPPRPTIYGETAVSITSIIAQELKPRLLGQPATDLSAMYPIKNNHTAKGALDMAVQDALAKSNGMTLVEFLGEKIKDLRLKNGIQTPILRQAQDRFFNLQSSIFVSYILGIGNDDTVLTEAQRVFDQGVRVLKVKVGRDWTADLRRIEALQAMFGGEMAIYADANECLGTDSAVYQLDQLAEMGVLYCEEPLPVELIQERAALRAGNHLPLIGDDSTFTERDLRRELALDTFDILNIKTARTGFTESLAMLALAQQADKGVMVGSQASAALGAARAGQFAALPGIEYPSELSFFLKLKEDIVEKRPLLQNGFISVADLNRVVVDEDLLREAEIK